MTPQEQQMIDGLIERVQNTQLSEKDPDAEQHLQQGLGRNPNALYILSQTVLVQGYALEQAQKQLADAKTALAQAQQAQQQPEPKHATSFLGSLFGSGDNKPAPPPPQQQSQYTPVPTYSQPQSYGQQYAPPQAYPPQSYGSPPSQGGGFLRGAMQTAAGVAAGAVAFEGIESLMHGFGGHGGGQGFGGFGGGDAPREEVVNNYYGDSSGRDHESHGFAGNDDIEDRRNDAASQTDFADTGDQNTGDDNSNSGDDFTSSDDDSSFDNSDSGGDDSSFDNSDSGGDDSSFS